MWISALINWLYWWIDKLIILSFFATFLFLFFYVVGPCFNDLWGEVWLLSGHGLIYFLNSPRPPKKWSLLLCWVERFGDDCLLMVLFNSGVAPKKYCLVWLPNWALPKHRQYKLISWYHEDVDGALHPWSCFNSSFKITQLSTRIFCCTSPPPLLPHTHKYITKWLQF